ncbi:F420-0:gamma-glutamyl ligase [Acanthocystis turfacea Chlorella virus TN603.4.2]|nr:F420-0:gamma-glutamyl ligase [Acanthocystis turfacea Chlorella virus TN603.4.2]
MLSADFSALTRSRRSTRDFLPTPIDPLVLKDILNEGITAPSWSNLRPFMIGIASGEKRDRISQALLEKLRSSAELPGMAANPDYTHVEPYPTGLLERSQDFGKGLYDALGIQRSDKSGRFGFLERNYEFFGAPTVLFFFAHKGMANMGTLDLGLYMQTVMLAAKASGLGTCTQGMLARYPDIVKSEFDVGEDYALVCGMSIGFPSDHTINDLKSERLPIDNFILGDLP